MDLYSYSYSTRTIPLSPIPSSSRVKSVAPPPFSLLRLGTRNVPAGPCGRIYAPDIDRARARSDRSLGRLTVRQYICSMTTVHVPPNQRCDSVDARISSGRNSWVSGPKNVVQIILVFDLIEQILRESTLCPPTTPAPKGNRGVFGHPTVTPIRRI